ncbi:MAG TPA: dihydrolipoyl dehydrogenase [Clostridia bacterium]|nr:dihydrolipoyl dehydrogenase [Clostridia bacterium]
MNTFDLIILGGGPAGYLAALRASKGGLKTAVFEKRFLGGVCLNEGCIPSKTLLNSAKIYEYATKGQKYGVTAENVVLDQATVIARKNKVIKQLVGGIAMGMKRANVTLFNSYASIKGKKSDVFTVIADGEEYSAKKILIATGSQPVLPHIPGLSEGIENGFCLTNREILELKEIPDSLVVIGAGAVGLEMASYYACAGSKVTVIEMLDKIAGSADEDISSILLKNCKRKGVNFKLNCKVTQINASGVAYEEKGELQSVEASKVLVSIGRKPAIDGLGLENIGVKIENNAIVTDEKLRTNVEGVYAAGDVNGKLMLAHTAFREAEVAANDMLGIDDKMKYNTVPTVIYTNPEIASVGETLESAEQKGMKVKAVSVSMRMSGRYVAEVEGGNGIAKLIVDTKTNTLVGVHLAGSYVSEIIYGAALMIETEMQIDGLKKIVFPHPTVCEVIREALFEI